MPPLPTAHQNPTETKTHIKKEKKKKTSDQPRTNSIKTQTVVEQNLDQNPIEKHTYRVVEQNPDQPRSKHNTQNPNIKKTHLLSKPQIIADQNTQNTTHIAPLLLDQHSHRCY